MTSYKDFWLRLERRGNELWVSSRSSDAGDTSAQLILPADVDNYHLGNLLGAERAIARGETQRDIVYKGEASKPDHVGNELYQALFPDQIRDAFNRNWGSGKDGGVRIRLQIDLNDPQLAKLASLPWELLYNEGTRTSLGRSKFTPIVRYLDVPLSYESYKLEGKLRVLIVLANPAGTHPLDLDREKESIEKTWAKLDGVDVTIVEHATRDAMFDKLDAGKYHVLHYMGHGGFDAQSGQGVLFLEDEDGNAAPLSGKMLGEALYEMRSMRLVFLNACDTGKSSHDQDLDPFSGVASALVMGGVPAVVAMQVPISDKAAVAFAEKFYTQLSHREPVDAAVAVGRSAIYRANETSLEWATPVLFMRAKDGRLFAEDVLNGPQVTPGSERDASEELNVPVLETPIESTQPVVAGGMSKYRHRRTIAGVTVLILAILGIWVLLSIINNGGEVIDPEVWTLMEDSGFPYRDDDHVQDVAQRLVDDRQDMERAGFTKVDETILLYSDDRRHERSVALDTDFEYAITGYSDSGCEELHLILHDEAGEELGADLGDRPSVRIADLYSPEVYKLGMELGNCFDADGNEGFVGLSVYSRRLDSLPIEDIPEPDVNGAPFTSSLHLDPGFDSDPTVVVVELIGGTDEVSISGPGCAGYVNNEGPDVNLQYGSDGEYLRFYSEPSGATVLMINLPDGSWLCNSDPNPEIVVSPPAAGRYNIWVGAYSLSDVNAEGTLYISENGPVGD